MNPVDFQTTIEAALFAFRQEDSDFDGIMDELSVHCTEEQWQSVLVMLEEEREQLKRVTKAADERLSKLPTFRPIEEFRIPGQVWLATFTNYDLLHIVDVCETRRGAAEAAEACALMRRQANYPKAQKLPWIESWKKAQWHCPCPISDCDHEQWTRRLRGGEEYVIQSWSTADDKSRFLSYSPISAVQSLRADVLANRDAPGDRDGDSVVQRPSPDE